MPANPTTKEMCCQPIGGMAACEGVILPYEHVNSIGSHMTYCLCVEESDAYEYAQRASVNLIKISQGRSSNVSRLHGELKMLRRSAGHFLQSCMDPSTCGAAVLLTTNSVPTTALPVLDELFTLVYQMKFQVEVVLIGNEVCVLYRYA